MRKNKRWTDERKQFLIDNYPDKSHEFLIDSLGITWGSILHKASELNVTRRNIFTKKDIEFISNNYNTMPYDEIAKILGRDMATVACKINKLGLIKYEKWTEKELELLIKYYPDYTNKYISKKILIGRAVHSIRTMGYKHNLYKSKKMGKNRYDEESMIEDLIKLSVKLGRTPIIEDLVENGLASGKTYERHFDGYCNACKIAGLKTYSNFWGKSITCWSINGDLCFSNSERIVTDFFIENDISYKKEVLYREKCSDDRCGLRRMDWLLFDEIFVEFFGMPEKPQYRKRMNYKIDICKDNDIFLIDLYAKDLTKLHKVFSQFL